MRNIPIDYRTVVVTGATSGIGLATAKGLAETGAYVIGIGRTVERCKKTEELIRSAIPNSRIAFLTADLSSQREIRELAKIIKNLLEKRGENPVIDALINNAGIFSSWFKQTEDGIELTFAVNHLAPFLLTHELLPLLSASRNGRVVTVGSSSHFHAKMKWNNLEMRRNYFGLNAYKQSKLANVLFTLEFNRRYRQKTGIRAFVADPGLVRTDIGLKESHTLVKLFWKHRIKKGASPEEGAVTSIYLATAPEILYSDNVYWKYKKPVTPNKSAFNEDSARTLWEITEQMCGLKK